MARQRVELSDAQVAEMTRLREDERLTKLQIAARMGVPRYRVTMAWGLLPEHLRERLPPSRQTIRDRRLAADACNGDKAFKPATDNHCVRCGMEFDEMLSPRRPGQTCRLCELQRLGWVILYPR